MGHNCYDGFWGDTAAGNLYTLLGQALDHFKEGGGRRAWSKETWWALRSLHREIERSMLPGAAIFIPAYVGNGTGGMPTPQELEDEFLLRALIYVFLEEFVLDEMDVTAGAHGPPVAQPQWMTTGAGPETSADGTDARVALVGLPTAAPMMGGTDIFTRVKAALDS